MAKEKMFFCSNCGERHKPKEKICKKCQRKLPVRSRLLYNYLKDGLIDEVQDKVEENIISLIVNFIKSHLYGTVLTFSIIATTTAIIATEVAESTRYEEVKTKPQVSITQKLEPAADYTVLSNVEKEYFKMLETKNTEQKEFLFRDDVVASYAPNITHQVLNDRDILYGYPSTTVVEKRECISTNNLSDATADTYLSSLNNIGLYGERCLYYINYCRDDSCPEKALAYPNDINLGYDYLSQIYVYYFQYEGTYYVLDDILEPNYASSNNFYRTQFYEAKGDVNLFFDNLVYPESAV